MIEAEFVQALKLAGYNFFSGVPCSVFKGVLNLIQNDPTIQYIPAVREDSALSLCVGAYLSGKKPAVIMQNSGLGNIGDVMIGLNYNYNIPILIIVSWRGYKRLDDPQHWLWGELQRDFLKGLHLSTIILSKKNAKRDLKKANYLMKRKEKPVILIVRPEIFYDSR